MFFEEHNTDGTRFRTDYTRSGLHRSADGGYNCTPGGDHIQKRLHMKETTDIKKGTHGRGLRIEGTKDTREKG